MAWSYFVAAGLFLDIVGFILIMKYGINLSLWAGYVGDLIGIPGTPEEREEERRENEVILRRRRYARTGIRLVVFGFTLQFIG